MKNKGSSYNKVTGIRQHNRHLFFIFFNILLTAHLNIFIY